MAKKDKKYYWLQLKKDFFKRHDIQIVEGMPNGKDYILFYLKLLCESVDHDGSLRFNDQIPYNEQMLSTITSTNVDVVKSAIEIFTQLKMMEVMDDGTYYLHEVQRMMGSESYWAEKKRTQRAEVGQCPTVSNSSPTCPSKRKILDIELDKEKDIKTMSETDVSDDVPIGKEDIKDIPYKEIIDYLNELAKTQYRHTSKSTKDKIKARYNDGFTIDDFKTVIEKKCKEWINTDMAKYLRPETLFGNKFEGYLNQLTTTNAEQKTLPSWYHDQSDMKPDHEFNEIELEQNLKKLRGEENET